jgi:hypothetical protein
VRYQKHIPASPRNHQNMPMSNKRQQPTKLQVTPVEIDKAATGQQHRKHKQPLHQLLRAASTADMAADNTKTDSKKTRNQPVMLLLAETPKTPQLAKSHPSANPPKTPKRIPTPFKKLAHRNIRPTQQPSPSQNFSILHQLIHLKI